MTVANAQSTQLLRRDHAFVQIGRAHVGPYPLRDRPQRSRRWALTKASTPSPTSLQVRIPDRLRYFCLRGEEPQPPRAPA